MRIFLFIKKAAAVALCLSVVISLFCVFPSASAAEVYDGVNLDVPQIRVVTENGNGTTLQKADGYVNAQISIKDTDGSELSDAVSFKVRGNTTALTWVTKKAFTFKFDKKKDVLGMGKGKKWALIANAFDPTLLRNYTAFELARELGLDYTSNQKFCELWVDGSFRGCYILYEPVQEGKDRVDIDIESNDGKKDFMLELEQKTVEDEVTYITVDNKKIRFAISEPEEPDEEQTAYIQDIMNDVFAAIKSGAQEDIEEKIDLDSFVKYYLLNEYLKTHDFDRTSVYFYYKDGKLYAGPAWDYDLCTGNEYPEFDSRTKSSSDSTGVFADKNLYKYLVQCDWFKKMVTVVYREHYDYITNIPAEGGFLDMAYAQYKPVIDRNYNEAGWNISKWWSNHIKKPLPTYEENIDFLKNWCIERNAWMTEYYKPFGNTRIIGDINGDKAVDILDATLIQKYTVDKAELTDEQIEISDVNDDGLVDIFDAADIQKYIVEKITEFNKKA